MSFNIGQLHINEQAIASNTVNDADFDYNQLCD